MVLPHPRKTARGSVTDILSIVQGLRTRSESHSTVVRRGMLTVPASLGRLGARHRQLVFVGRSNFVPFETELYQLCSAISLHL